MLERSHGCQARYMGVLDSVQCPAMNPGPASMSTLEGDLEPCQEGHGGAAGGWGFRGH